MNSFSLEGKVALVTGGSRGIGAAICTALSNAGATVAYTYIRNLEAAKSVNTSLAGNKSAMYQMDVLNRVQVRSVINNIEKDFGGLDILVNNAGINKPTDFDQVTDDEWDSIIGVNLKGPFICAQEAISTLKARGGGSIINIGSISGQYGGPRTAHYAASKAGLISLGQVIARFGAENNIRCNTIAAGLIESDMATAGMQSAAVNKAAENILLKRLGTRSDVANAVVFLASDAAQYITAQTINVNGGLYF